MKHSFLLALLLVAGTTGAFGDSIFVSPAFQDVSVGQIFTVDINVDQILNLYDYQFSLSYNAQALSAQSITEGSLFADTNNSYFGPGSIDNNAGSITLTYDTLLGSSAVAGPGTLAVVQFEAISPGTSSIDFSPLGDLILQDANGATLPVTPVSGTVTAVTPENATFATMALGLCLIGLGLRRRSRFKNAPCAVR